ncbi:MAG TPA: thioredoxin domain-containing protein [Bryobacteraceae bacterium]|nr:thioredoxin domain-containing protein [Bryobacteraceae bacterium]
MQRNCALGTLLALCICGVLAAAEAEPPKLDKPKLEAYIRYAEGFNSDVQFSIDDPIPSAYKGYFRVVAHLTKGLNRLDRVYYVTPDGQHFVNGTIWDLSDSPFLDTLQHLPTDGPSFGPTTAKVTIVVFSDFECPYCRQLAKTLRDNIPQKFPNDVRVIFKDYPIESIHPWARAAAEASHCIADQKIPAFWAFHDWIFEHQQEVNQTNLREKTLAFAKENGLDAAKIANCIDTHATAPIVDQSLKAGQGLQIEQTPTLFIDGRAVGGAISWEQMQSLIDLELKRPANVPGPPVEKCCEVPISTVVKKP